MESRTEESLNDVYESLAEESWDNNGSAGRQVDAAVYIQSTGTGQRLELRDANSIRFTKEQVIDLFCLLVDGYE